MMDQDAAATVILGPGPSPGGTARVVLYGPSRAGKSTLLARLLVEAGRTVPPWLLDALAGAGTAGQVELDGLTVVDAPDAVPPGSDADLVMIVVTTALALDDGFLDRVRPFAAGRSAVWVIAQCDDLADIEDDRRRYRSATAAIRARFVTGLRRAGLAVDEAAVHTVAADPYAESFLDGAPGRKEFARYRKSDGVDQLRADLAGRTGFPERRAAVRRELARVQAEVDIAGLAADLRRLDDLTTAFTAFDEDLATIDRGARNALRATVDTVLTDLAAMRRTDSAGQLAGALEGELPAHLVRWRREWGGYLEDLAGRAARAVPDALLAEPDGGDLAGHLTGVSRPARKKFDVAKGIKLFGGHTETPTKGAATLWSLGRYGSRLSTIKTELANVEALGWDRYAASGGRLLNENHARKVKTFSARADTVIKVVPIAAEALQIVATYYFDERTAQLKADVDEARAASIAAAAERIAGDIAGDGPRSWAVAVAVVEAALIAGLPDPDEVQALRSRVTELSDAAGALTQTR